MAKPAQPKPPKPRKSKTCPICESDYLPWSSTQKTCNEIPCAMAFAKQQAAEKSAREIRKQKKLQRIEWNKRKSDLKPLSHWLNLTQRVFNDFIRLRDGDVCISCGSTTATNYHAGHYRTTAAASQLRFNEDGCHSQCASCNTHHSGNIGPYRINLIAKIGPQRVEALENNNTPHRYNRDELERIRKRYRALIREMTKQQEAA